MWPRRNSGLRSSGQAARLDRKEIDPASIARLDCGQEAEPTRLGNEQQQRNTNEKSMGGAETAEAGRLCAMRRCRFLMRTRGRFFVLKRPAVKGLLVSALLALALGAALLAIAAAALLLTDHAARAQFGQAFSFRNYDHLRTKEEKTAAALKDLYVAFPSGSRAQD